MPRASGKTSSPHFIMALLIFMGSAICFPGPVSAQEAPAGSAPPLFKMETDAQYRYFESNGVPAAAAQTAKPQTYLFRAPLTPVRAETATKTGPDMFFGVALDGVPMDSPATAPRMSAAAGGGLAERDGVYTYTGIPEALVSKDLSHVGYAADGFPVFVSKSKKFKSGYNAKGNYKPGAGNLDLCNGVTVNGKFYIYVLTQEFPPTPLCWSGSPDKSFLKRAASQTKASKKDAKEQSSPGRRGRREDR